MEIDTTTATAAQSRFDKMLTTYLQRRSFFDGLPSDTSEEEEEAYSASFSRAEKDFLRVPAKTLSQLRSKAEIIWNDGGSCPGEEMVSLFFADLLDLTDHSPSQTFNAEEWLRWHERCGGGWVERDGEIILLFPDRPNGGASDVCWALDTRDGSEAVKQLIRERSKRKTDTAEKTTSPPVDENAAEELTAGDKFSLAHSAWRSAKAAWDLALYTPEMINRDLPKEDESRLCDAHSKALYDFFHTPAPDMYGLLRKLRAYQEEEVQALFIADSVMTEIVQDTARISRGAA